MERLIIKKKNLTKSKKKKAFKKKLNKKIDKYYL